MKITKSTLPDGDMVKSLRCCHNWLALKYKRCIAAQNKPFRILPWLLWNVHCVIYYTGMMCKHCFDRVSAVREEWGELEEIRAF